MKDKTTVNRATGLMRVKGASKRWIFGKLETMLQECSFERKTELFSPKSAFEEYLSSFRI